MPDCGPKHFFNCADQMCGLLGIQRKTASGRMNLGQKQRFARVNIPKSGDPALIEEERFDLLPAFLKQGPKPLTVERRT
jgi:hypothetical protein